MSFTIFQNEETPFQAIRERGPKSRKIEIFPNFFFRQFKPGKCLLRYSRTKKCLSRISKEEVQKVEKLTSFSKELTHGFGPKVSIFPTFFFKEIQTRKMSFTIFQNEKTPFYAIKSKSSKTRNINIFPKGLTHGFGPKMIIFASFFFKAVKTRKMFLTIFQSEKTPFYAIKSKSSRT